MKSWPSKAIQLQEYINAITQIYWHTYKKNKSTKNVPVFCTEYDRWSLCKPTCTKKVFNFNTIQAWRWTRAFYWATEFLLINGPKQNSILILMMHFIICNAGSVSLATAIWDFFLFRKCNSDSLKQTLNHRNCFLMWPICSYNCSRSPWHIYL